MANAHIQLDLKLISLEVSPFTFQDYLDLFQLYDNHYTSNELQSILDEIGFNLEKPTAIGYKKDGSSTLLKIASNEEEYKESVKELQRVEQIGRWTIPQYSLEKFINEMATIFSHSCKIDYTIANIATPNANTIICRRIYTLSRRLGTMQVVEFILEEGKWIYINWNELYMQKQKQEKQNKQQSKQQIYEKYKPHLDLIMKFNLEYFEELDDKEIWEHPLYQCGTHTISYH